MDSSTTNADAYLLLGVEPSAGASEVRLAFRKAALKYHPDLFEGDPADAQAAFCRLVEAYHRAMRQIGQRQAGPVKAVTPQELAQMDGSLYQWDFVSMPAGSILGAQGRKLPPGTKVRSAATLDEPVAFNLIWIAAMIVSAGLMVLIAWRWQGALDSASVLAVVLLPLALYAACLAAGLALLVLTRRAVYLVLRLRRQKLLPQTTKLPRRGILSRLTGK